MLTTQALQVQGQDSDDVLNESFFCGNNGRSGDVRHDTCSSRAGEVSKKKQCDNK